MTPTEKFHLAAFRAACRHSGVSCVIGDVSLVALAARRKPEPAKLPPGNLSDSPQLFTVAAEDFELGGLPTRGADVEAGGLVYRIASLDPQGPLVVLNCTAGVPA